MNNQKTIVIIGSASLGIIALALVFMAGRASDGGRSCGFDGNNQMMGMRGEMKGSQHQMKGGKGGERGMMKGAMQFIDQSALSDEQKDQLEKLQDAQREKMQSLMQEARQGSGNNSDELTTKIDALWKEHMTQIRTFVAQDKLTEFDAFVAEGKPETGKMGRKMGGNW